MENVNFFQETKYRIYKGCCNIIVDILNFNDNKITYRVSNVPLHTFDQHSRARIGVKFFDVEYSNAIYSLYTETFNKLSSNKEMLKKFFNVIEKIDKAESITFHKKDLLLMSRNCSYTVEQDYNSLRGQMARRLKLCEEEQIVGLHFILREKMIKNGIKLAESFRPGCDLTGVCDYIAVSDHLSNAFGALFDACGRWDYDKTVYRSFNKSCTTPQLIKEQTGIDIIRSQYEIDNKIR